MFKILGKAEAMSVLRTLSEEGPMGFNELKKAVRTDPKTLTRRIDELTDINLVSQDSDSDYDLTEKGKDILEIADEVDTLFNSEVAEVDRR